MIGAGGACGSKVGARIVLASAMMRQLRLLVVRHEALDVDHLRDGRQLHQLGLQRLGGRHVRVDQDVDAVRIGDRIVHQVVQRAHRLGVRVLGVQRIGIERRAAARPRSPAPPTRRTTARIGRRCRATIGSNGASQAKPTTACLAARTAQRDDGRQEAQRADEGDQHADAGDQAEFRHAGEAVGTKPRKPADVAHRGDRI